MHKDKIWLAAALGWTTIVALLCLVQLTNLPDVGVSSPDKYVHSVFHFFFTVFWFQYMHVRGKQSTTKKLLTVFILSLLFGAAIELAQMFLTASRTAEIRDVLANGIGSILAVCALSVYLKIRAKR